MSYEEDQAGSSESELEPAIEAELAVLASSLAELHDQQTMRSILSVKTVH
jgi:hypothetical protein